ncbi:MAG: TonB-dependent receptor [Candidatus Latescibacterota bacterium]
MMAIFVKITCCILLSTMTAAPLRAAGNELKGRVIDASSEKPVPDVFVFLVKDGASGVTGDDGWFIIETSKTGQDTLVCQNTDYTEKKIAVTIPGTVEVRLETEMYVLETVEVRAAKPDELPPYERTSASVNLITRENIPERSATVDEVLDSEIGVDTRSLGGIGGRTTISIRGSTSDQVSVYMDGIPLSAGGSGVSGFAFVPMSQVDRIEIYRGTSPGTFGSGAMGGVVNISSPPTQKGGGIDASTSYGSFGTNHQTAMLRFGEKWGRVLLSAGRNASENNFRYLDNRGTTIDKSDDGWEKKKNSDFESENYMARWDETIGGSHSFMAKISATDTGHGVSGLGSRPVFDARVSSLGLLAQTRYCYRDLADTQIWFMKEKLNFSDPSDESGKIGRQDTDDTIKVQGVTSNVKHVFGPGLFTTQVEYKVETYESRDSFDTSVTLPSKRSSLGAGIEAEIMFLDGALWVCPRMYTTLVKDHIQDTSIFLAHLAADSTTSIDRHSTAYSLGLRYRIKPSLTLRANAGLFPRLPQFSELFGDTGDVVGNTKLTEEKGANFDTGFYYHPGAGTFEADMSVFYRSAKDLIQRRTYGDYLISENIGKAEIAGVESWVGGSFPKFPATYRFSISCQDAKNRSDETVIQKQRYFGKYLPYHPIWKGNTRVSVRKFEHLSLIWKMDWEGECYKGPSNLSDEKLPSRVIHSIVLRSNIWDHLDAVFEAANITDNHAPDRWGYPKPGRGFYITLAWNGEFGESNKTDKK